MPFLDTDTTKEMPVANAELNSRGYPDWLIHTLRGIARPGLWYQNVAWEWGSLGAYDVLLGYSVLLMFASPFVAMLSSLFFGSFVWGVVPLALGLLAVAIAWLGMRRRRRAG